MRHRQTWRGWAGQAPPKGWNMRARLRKPSYDCVERQILALPRTPVLAFDVTGGQAARTDDQLVGEADQIHSGELCAGALVAIVVENIDPGIAQFAVEV